ncbi:MAG TPA: transcriptional regulator [Candidatus Lokiarchaeia archaeon]|nr:transcriptional regulator [Candidatus Lokiarchaeia archaeon]
MADDYENVSETRRQRLLRMLESTTGPLDLRFLLKELEYENKKYLISDVERIAAALRRENRVLLVQPPTCIACGFIFPVAGKKFRIPTKCPKCRKERIAWPSIKLG